MAALAQHNSLADYYFELLKNINPDSKLDLISNFRNRCSLQLGKQGLLIDDFAIPLGATAIVNDMTMVTNNIAHPGRLDSVTTGDWTSMAKK